MSAGQGKDFDVGWDGPRERQARAGRALTPLERLRWLSRTVEELRRVQGLAARQPPHRDKDPR